MENQANQAIAPQTQRAQPSHCSNSELVSQLSACLAVVRPVGMSDSAATEWLAVAAAEVRNMPKSAIDAGCREARQTCTHHGQILPTILRHMPRPDPMADRFLRDWRAASIEAQNGFPAVTYRGSAKRVGDVVKMIVPE